MLKVQKEIIKQQSQRLFERWSLDVCKLELTKMQERIEIERIRLNVLQSVINVKKGEK